MGAYDLDGSISECCSRVEGIDMVVFPIIMADPVSIGDITSLI